MKLFICKKIVKLFYKLHSLTLEMGLLHFSNLKGMYIQKIINLYIRSLSNIQAKYKTLLLAWIYCTSLVIPFSHITNWKERCFFLMPYNRRIQLQRLRCTARVRLWKNNHTTCKMLPLISQVGRTGVLCAQLAKPSHTQKDICSNAHPTWC